MHVYQIQMLYIYINIQSLDQHNYYHKENIRDFIFGLDVERNNFICEYGFIMPEN